VIGFVGLAAVWSVAGSLVTRQEELQASTLPAQALLLIPYILSVAASKTVLAWISVIPIWSSLIMPGRIATGDATWWQVALALGLAVLAAIGLVRLGARLYERTLLQTAHRSSYREVLRRSP
jgi:ABC-2 type transport system permease protein